MSENNKKGAAEAAPTILTMAHHAGLNGAEPEGEIYIQVPPPITYYHIISILSREALGIDKNQPICYPLVRTLKEKGAQMERMRLSALDNRILFLIAQIYDRVVGAHATRDYPGTGFPDSLETIKKEILSGHPREYRFGSILDRNSKLWIEGRGWTSDGECLIFFRFDANINWRSKEADKLEKAFERAVDEFLNKQGLAYQG